MSNIKVSGIILITGPVHSGKSKFAENILSSFKNVTYLATGIIDDGTKAWREKVNIHKNRRPSYWKTIETTNISKIIKENTCETTLLIDSLGGFINANIELSEEEWLDKLSNTLNNIINFGSFNFSFIKCYAYNRIGIVWVILSETTV